MDHLNIISIVMDCLNIISIVIAIFALYISRLTYLALRKQTVVNEKDATVNENNSKAMLFIQMRDKYSKIYANFPTDNKDFEYEIYQHELKEYWINSFNEWYITNKVCPSYKLWDQFYESAIKKTLRKSAFKEALYYMNEEDFSFGSDSLKDEFFKAIEFDKQPSPGDPKMQDSVFHQQLQFNENN
ncbi:hypothetical protein [Vibrio aerogenes]|uniref:hypothetical protein n=1 Tax=Vibrio aerogenes TaxID=92172 RepID=UPI0021C284A2|nr:hypothetical protein [Vibrio aerogenes]